MSSLSFPQILRHSLQPVIPTTYCPSVRSLRFTDFLRRSILYGVMGVRTRVPPSIVGSLFLVLVILSIAQVIGFAFFDVSTSAQLFGLGPVDIWVPAVLVVIAYLLYTNSRPAGHSEGSTEPAT